MTQSNSENDNPNFANFLETPGHCNTVETPLR